MANQFHPTAGGYKIAYQQQPGDRSRPGVVFCPGYRSDMSSTKATALSEWCAANNVALTRFDYNGHGKSEGEFEQFTIGRAFADLLEVLDHLAPGPQILIGSSMGGWVSLLAARERKGQIKAFIGIAPAPDFTERLMYPRMTPEQREELDNEGKIWVHSDYTASDYAITREFIHEARKHLLLDDVIGIAIPIQLIHGQEDVDVPWENSLLLAKQLVNDEVVITLVKDGDHRLNRPADLKLMTDAIARLLEL